MAGGKPASSRFYCPGYWKDNQSMVKALLPQAEVYVYEKDGEILGFAGLDGAYIEGIFVSEKARSQGIGKCLLDFLKTKKAELHLNVYQKNTRAIWFYEREGFAIRGEGLDEATGERDYAMAWEIAGKTDKKHGQCTSPHEIFSAR